MPVKIEDVVHRSGNHCVTSHWVRPSSWVRELMRLYPGSLTGGLTDINDIDLQFRTFWRLYQQFHGDHQIFSSPLQHHLGRVIPIALFGDEGRGPKRGQFLVWSMESVLGLDYDYVLFIYIYRHQLAATHSFTLWQGLSNVPLPLGMWNSLAI